MAATNNGKIMYLKSSDPCLVSAVGACLQAIFALKSRASSLLQRHLSGPVLITAFALSAPTALPASDTVALWLFDEPAGLYPSSVLDSSDGLDAPLVLGLGGQLVDGRMGRALSTEPHAAIELPEKGEKTAFLHRLPVPAGRRTEPLTWPNAQFAALMTGGERHLRKEVSFIDPIASDLNLGEFDWTVEFWLRCDRPVAGPGVIFEIGTGPRGENDEVTRCTFDPAAGEFVLHNRPAGTDLRLPTDRAAFGDGGWHHCALVYRGKDGELVHFLDGRSHFIAHGRVRKLPEGRESYMSVGRDGAWGRPLAGALDELRFSRGRVYTGDFDPPGSFAPAVPKAERHRGPPPLFSPPADPAGVVPLGSRKYVFIDEALIAEREGIRFAPRPPQRIERVIDHIHGQFRKHLTVIEDSDGLIRLYNGGPDDYLIVHISREGTTFTEPDTGIHHKGRKNIVIPEPAPLGRPIIDPNGPPEARWKYLSGCEGRGVYLYISPDGWRWRRLRSAASPFRSGSQSSFFYDDQRGLYVAYHRTGFGMTPGGATKREFVMTETADPYHPWPITPLTQAEVRAIAKARPLREPQPWWLDNGPLTPGDFGAEYRVVFTTDPAIDRPGDGIYVPKATKYPWAPDTYVAFPALYHQYGEGSLSEKLLLAPRLWFHGSGEFETHVAVSRDGIHWRRYPRPAYLPELSYEGRVLHQIYMAEGLIQRGVEIWQYFYGQEDYHSARSRHDAGNAVYRVVQRLDGFVAAEAQDQRPAKIVTRPFTFTGDRLELNIDTGSRGWAQAGFLDGEGRAIPGFSVDDGERFRGNSVKLRVRWPSSGEDVSALAGRAVRLVIHMQGASLYALQFVQK